MANREPCTWTTAGAFRVVLEARLQTRASKVPHCRRPPIPLLWPGENRVQRSSLAGHQHLDYDLRVLRTFKCRWDALRTFVFKLREKGPVKAPQGRGMGGLNDLLF